jgi:uroporphyrinogen-III decarboxylase
MDTARNNFKAALTGQPHGRMAATVVIDNFNYPQPLPKGLDPARATLIEEDGGFTFPESILELSKYYGLDSLLRITPPVIKTTIGRGFRVTHKNHPQGRRTTYTGRRGTVTEHAAASIEAGTVFKNEYPVKTPEDYRVLIEYLESQSYEINETNIAESRRHLALVGDNGIAYTVAPASPIMDLMRSWAGIEQFVYHLAETPDIVREVLSIMEDRYIQQWELMADSTPCEFMVNWDDSNTHWLSPGMFEEYAAPALRRYAGIAHSHGKYFVMHTCGSINAILPLIRDMGVDAVDWVSPAPTGDVAPRKVQSCWDGKVSMLLTCSPEVLRNGSPEDCVKHVRVVLDGINTTGAMAFMIAAPIGTPVKNMAALVRLLRDEYGVPLRRSNKYGSILD